MYGDGSGIAELMVVQDGSAVFSKSFIKLVFDLSDVLASGIYISCIASSFLGNVP